MTLLPSNIPAFNVIPRKETDDGTTIQSIPLEYPNVRAVTQPRVDLRKAKKRDRSDTDVQVGNPKKIRGVVTEDSDIEMTNNDVFT
jgi:hypothetical protein